MTLDFGPNADGQRPTVEEAVKKNPIVSLLLAVVVVWGAVSGVRDIGGAIYSAINWQAAEIAKVDTLRVDMPVSRVKETFGEADHVEKMNQTDEGDQMIWKERGYFLVLHQVDQIVTSYAIHACDSSIRPSVGIGAGKVVANETKLSGPEQTQWPPRRAYYNWAPSFIEMYEGRVGGRAEALPGGLLGPRRGVQLAAPRVYAAARVYHDG